MFQLDDSVADANCGICCASIHTLNVPIAGINRSGFQSLIGKLAIAMITLPFLN